MMQRYTSVHLKWLAIITMTIDHFGVIVLLPYTNNATVDVAYVIARLIGRIAFPLFAFMIAEGMMWTRSPIKYWSRLTFMTILIALAMWALKLFNINALAGNIFIDLSMAALAMLFLREKKWWKKIFALIPILYVIYASLTPNYPNFIRPDYGIYGLIMMLMFFAILITKKSPNNWFNGLLKLFGKNDSLQPPMNVYQVVSISLLILHILWYIIYLVGSNVSAISSPVVTYLGQFIGGQSYAILAAFFIHRYDGSKGQAPAWFKTFTYLYYPLHFVVLYAVYLITTI
jgi:hypothetical protein